MFGKDKEEKKVFVCVTDTWQNGTYYSRGDKITADACPPHFEEAPNLQPEDLEE